MPFTYEHPRPGLTADVVLLAATEAGPRILLIRRAREPFAGRWALPGGFVELDEELPDAARRELAEETGVVVGELAEVGTFGRVGRDPRGRTISVAFAALQVGELPAPQAGDDSADARWHPLRRLPPLAFDHREIVARALEVLRGRAQHGDGLTPLMPPRFTLRELAAIHAMVMGSAPAPAALGARLRRRGLLRRASGRRGRERLYAAPRDGRLD